MNSIAYKAALLSYATGVRLTHTWVTTVRPTHTWVTTVRPTHTWVTTVKPTHSYATGVKLILKLPLWGSLWIVFWVGEHQHQLAHWCSLCDFCFCTYMKCEVKTYNGIWGWGIPGLNGCCSYGKVSYCFGEICSKNTCLEGSTLSSHCMTTCFGSFEL